MESNSIKILFCDNTLWGLINFRIDVISYFVDRGFDVVLVAPEKEDAQMRISLPEKIRYIPIEMGRTTTNPLNDVRYFFRLLKIFKKEKPDFVFNYTIKPNIYGTIAAKICKSYTVAMMAGLGYTFENDTFKTKIARMLYKIGLMFTDNLFLLNESNVATVIQNKICDKRKIILLDGGEGVDLNRFHFHDNESKSTTFLFIGRVLWDKGYDEFSKAARIVKKSRPDVKFKVLGSLDPSYPKSVPIERINQDEKSGLIEYIGFTNDMNLIYSQKGIVVTLPSYYGEGMNRSLMEACASGKPIITTCISGCKELVIDGENGFIVEPKDTNSLVKAMMMYINLSDEDKSRLSLNSRKLAEDRFDVRKVVSVYAGIIDKRLKMS